MRLAAVLVSIALGAGLLEAQDPTPEGVQPVWNVKTMCRELSGQLSRFDPLLEKVNPKEWKHSAEAYSRQLEDLQKQIGYLKRALNELGADPGRMTKALEAFLRMQTVESMMQSMIAGVRRYQNPAMADLLQGVLNEVGPYAQALQDYLVQLVAQKEAEFKIIDEEAQRCRSQLIQGKD